MAYIYIDMYLINNEYCSMICLMCFEIIFLIFKIYCLYVIFTIFVRLIYIHYVIRDIYNLYQKGICTYFISYLLNTYYVLYHILKRH